MLRYLRTLTTWHCPHSSAARRCYSNRLISLPAGPTAANLQQQVCHCGPMLGQRDGRTDRLTPYRFIDPAPYILCGRCQKMRRAVLSLRIQTRLQKKGKGSPYSIAEHRVPELIPVLSSQPAGDVSHKPGGRLPLLSARPAVTPATLKRAATNFAAW